MYTRDTGNPVLENLGGLYCIEDLRNEKAKVAKKLYLNSNDGYVCTLIAESRRGQFILTLSLEDLDAVVQAMKERRNKETWKTKSLQASPPIDASNSETSLEDW